MPATTSTSDRRSSGSPPVRRTWRDAETDEDETSRTQLLVGEHLGLGHPRQALGRHAVGAAQVAAVGHARRAGHAPPGRTGRADRWPSGRAGRADRRRRVGEADHEPLYAGYRAQRARVSATRAGWLRALVAGLLGVRLLLAGLWQWHRSRGEQRDEGRRDRRRTTTHAPAAGSPCRRAAPSPRDEQWTAGHRRPARYAAGQRPARAQPRRSERRSARGAGAPARRRGGPDDPRRPRLGANADADAELPTVPTPPSGEVTVTGVVACG